MSSQKSKQNFINLQVKAIIANFVIIIGEADNKNKDFLAYVPDESLFEKILLGEDYEINLDQIILIASINSIKKNVLKRVEKIFRLIDSEPSIAEDITVPELNVIKQFITTKEMLQHLEYTSFLEPEIRDRIQENKAMTFLESYFYLFGIEDLKKALKMDEEDEYDIEQILKTVLKAYEILKHANLDQAKTIATVSYKLKELLREPLDVDIKINTNVLDLLRITMELKKLNEGESKIWDDLHTIEEELKAKELLKQIPEATEDQETKDLEKEKEELEKRLKEIENKKNELREKLYKLIRNK